MVWQHSGSYRPKCPECKNPLENLSPASIFWDQDGILLIDYFPQGQTINAEYYSPLLVQLKDISKEKRHRKFTNGVLFLQDNALAHRALAAQKKLGYVGFQYLHHPPYSPHLAPSNYPVSWTKKTTEMSLFFGGHCCTGTWLDEQLSVFFFEWLAKVKSNGLRSVLRFVGSVLNKSQVWSL
jgi:hypothetical protein